jgi:hypothetical protein
MPSTRALHGLSGRKSIVAVSAPSEQLEAAAISDISADVPSRRGSLELIAGADI